MPFRYIATSVALNYLSSSYNSEDGLTFRLEWDLASVYLFILFAAATFYYGLQESHPHASVVNQPVSEDDNSKFACGDPSKYGSNGIPLNTTIPHWWRQLFFDIGVYCVPTLALGLYCPKLGHFFLLWFAAFRPTYDIVMSYLLLSVHS